MNEPLVIGLFVGALIIVGWLLRHLAEWLLGEHRAQRRAPLTPVAAVTAGKRCRVVGVARRHPQHAPLTAPFSAAEVLLCRSELLRYDRSSDSPDPYDVVTREDAAVELFCVEDASGSVAVRPKGPGARPQLKLSERRRMAEVPMDKVEAQLRLKGMKPTDVEEGFPWGWTVLPSDYYAAEAALREGDRVAIVGMVSAAEAEEGAPPELQLGGAADYELFLTNEKKMVARLAR